jgi:hypothetical protein
MKKIIYNGDITPCRIVIYGSEYKWSSGEVKELDDTHAKKLVEDNSHFTYIDKIEHTEVKKENTIDTMSKDDLLDYTANHDIKADYSMTKEKLKEKIKNK